MQEVHEASRMRAYRLAAPIKLYLTLPTLGICICLLLDFDFSSFSSPQKNKIALTDTYTPFTIVVIYSSMRLRLFPCRLQHRTTTPTSNHHPTRQKLNKSLKPPQCAHLASCRKENPLYTKNEAPSSHPSSYASILRHWPNEFASWAPSWTFPGERNPAN